MNLPDCLADPAACVVNATGEDPRVRILEDPFVKRWPPEWLGSSITWAFLALHMQA